jgi:hypothetical protein
MIDRALANVLLVIQACLTSHVLPLIVGSVSVRGRARRGELVNLTTTPDKRANRMHQVEFTR